MAGNGDVSRKRGDGGGGGGCSDRRGASTGIGDEASWRSPGASGEVRSEAVARIGICGDSPSGVVQEEIAEAWAASLRPEVVAVENAVLATLVVEALGVVWQDQGNVEMAPAVSEEEEVERLESQVAALVE